MALTTNSTVWKILGIIFVLMSAVFYLFYVFQTIFVTIIVGLVFIILAEQIKKHYRLRMNHIHPKAQTFVAFILIIFWCLIIVYLIGNSLDSLGGALSSQTGENQTLASIFKDKVQPGIERTFPPVFRERLITPENLEKLEGFVFGFLTSFFSSFSAFVLNGILIIPVMMYIYYNKREKISRGLYHCVPHKYKSDYVRASSAISAQLKDFLTAKVMESMIIAFICCLGFFIVGVKGWLVLGLLAGFLNIVPFLGPLLGAIPPLLVTLLVDEPIFALYVLITIAIAQLIDNLYLQPFFISDKVKIEALISIMLILAGSQLFGVFGMIFAIPFYLIYKIVLQESYRGLVRVYGNK